MIAVIETSPATIRELTLKRTFNAPRALVFAGFTDPAQLARWWGPQGFTNPVCEMDARVGGALRIDMRGPAGTIFDTVYKLTGGVREIVAPERLVFTVTLHEDDGSIRLENLTSVTFAEHAGKTTITLRVTVVRATEAAAANLAGMEAGWSQSLERLADHVTRFVVANT
jgi:uncharacterized protein YndB with AHSA1/START domain